MKKGHAPSQSSRCWAAGKGWNGGKKPELRITQMNRRYLNGRRLEQAAADHPESVSIPGVEMEEENLGY